MSPRMTMPADAGRHFKIVVCFERRSDGGLRAWSDSVPGFVLSHKNVDALLADIKPALEGILSARMGRCMVTDPLDELRLELEDQGVVDASAPHFFGTKEYVAYCQ